MTADPAHFVIVPVLVGLIVHAAAEARRDRIARDKAQGKRIVDRAEADNRVAGGAR